MRFRCIWMMNMWSFSAIVRLPKNDRNPHPWALRGLTTYGIHTRSDTEKRGIGNQIQSTATRDERSKKHCLRRSSIIAHEVKMSSNIVRVDSDAKHLVILIANRLLPAERPPRPSDHHRVIEEVSCVVLSLLEPLLFMQPSSKRCCNAAESTRARSARFWSADSTVIARC